MCANLISILGGSIPATMEFGKRPMCLKLYTVLSAGCFCCGSRTRVYVQFFEDGFQMPLYRIRGNE